MRIKATGLAKARSALNREMRKLDYIDNEIVGAILRGVAMRTRPYVPVDTSALLNSERIIVRGGKYRSNGYVGYGYGSARSRSGTPVSKYFAYVHDGPQKNWKKAGASNRYLEKGYRDFLRYDLRDVIARFTS